jgi:hypothetical protein
VAKKTSKAGSQASRAADPPAPPQSEKEPPKPREIPPWQSKATLVAAFIGVGVTGVVVGRATSPAPAPPPPAPTASQSAETTPEPPQQFDLTEIPGYATGIPLRPMDRDIFAEILSPKLERSKMRDVFPDRPYRVTFVGSASEHRIGLVLVDMDRDGKIDERWELKKTEVRREVEKDPATDRQAVRYTLAHGRWQLH